MERDSLLSQRVTVYLLEIWNAPRSWNKTLGANKYAYIYLPYFWDSIIECLVNWGKRPCFPTPCEFQQHAYVNMRACHDKRLPRIVFLDFLSIKLSSCHMIHYVENEKKKQQEYKMTTVFFLIFISYVCVSESFVQLGYLFWLSKKSSTFFCKTYFWGLRELFELY